MSQQTAVTDISTIYNILYGILSQCIISSLWILGKRDGPDKSRAL